tara:strand:- start:21 stop:155 length:135 start_codon:yes stop_codon:yes gene_type:complete
MQPRSIQALETPGDAQFTKFGNVTECLKFCPILAAKINEIGHEA